MKKILILTVLTLFFVSGCNKVEQTDEINEDKIQIKTSVYQLKYLIEEISSNEYVDVQSIYPSGGDIHDYEPTARDIQEILESDYLFVIDEKFETFLPTIKDNIKSSNSNLKIIEISKYDEMISTFEDNDYLDDNKTQLKNYHFWLSPKKALVISQIIYNEMIKMDKEHTNLYKENYDILVDRLTKIDEEYNNFTKDTTIYVTHDAYYWLSKDYGIDIYGLKGNDHHDEPSSSELEEVIENINDNDIEVIYAEVGSENDELIKMISSETNTEIRYLNNFEYEISGVDYIQGLEDNLKEMSI